MGTGLLWDVGTPNGRVDHSESRFGPEKSLCANISRMSGSVIAFLKRRRGENHRAEPWINGLRPIGSSGFGFALEVNPIQEPELQRYPARVEKFCSNFVIRKIMGDITVPFVEAVVDRMFNADEVTSVVDLAKLECLKRKIVSLFFTR